MEALIRRAVRAPWDPATVVALGVTLLVLAMWMLRADEPQAHASAEALDTRAVDAPLAVVRERWEAEFARLREQVRTLAVHDATYEFVRRPNFPYVDDHFGPKSLAGLAVDTVLIVDAKSRPIFWRRPNDPDNQGFPDAELFLAQLPKLSAPRERAERGQPTFEGIVQFRGVPQLVSAIAVEPPEGDGAPRGYLIYGRALDGAAAQRVREGAPAGIDVMPANDALLPAEVRIRLDRSLTPLVVADEQRLRGYLPLVDVQGRLVRVYAVSAAKPMPAPAAPPTGGGRSSWPKVLGALLLLLGIGAAWLWWTFKPARVAPRSDVERLARALAAETSPGRKPADAPVVPGVPQVAVAEALVGLGATADEPPMPEWLRARPDSAPAAAAVAASAVAPLPAPAGATALTSPARGPHDARDAHDADGTLDAGDDHEWLVGTPDEVLRGEHDTVIADALDGEAAQARSAGVRGGTADTATFEVHFEAPDVAEPPVRIPASLPPADAVASVADVASGAEGAVVEATVIDSDAIEPEATVARATVIEADVAEAAGTADVVAEPAVAGDTDSERCDTDATTAPAFAPPAPAATDAPPAFDAVAAAAARTPARDAQAAVVRRLLEDGRLRVHYQPQVSTANGTIAGVEALVRWQDDAAALRAAGELFGDGTSADSFSGATEFVLRRACADRRAWMRQIGRTLPVSVNVGIAELREPDFIARVLRILEDADLPPAYLELEVPERALAVPGSPETDALEQAYRRGIAIAIGGFVAADAPLRALTQVPVAKLKLHRSLVADLPDDTHARMVVDAVLAIGRTLNVTVCAEGVERPAQAAYLERRQCPLVQGWHYARPMDADQLFALMKGSGVDTVRLPLMDVEELEAHARAAGVV